MNEHVADWESEVAYQMFIVEKECGTGLILESYPLMKYYSQLESLKRYAEEQERARRK